MHKLRPTLLILAITACFGAVGFFQPKGVIMHNITERNGTAEFFSGMGKKAWHGLGKIIDGLATASECLIHANLDWTVSKQPLFIKNPLHDVTNPESPKGYTVPDQFAIIRDDIQGRDDILGVVGKKYRPYQNHEALSMLDPITQNGQAIYECAGSMAGGRKVFLLAKIPENIIVNGNDPVTPYILISTSHDGSGSLIAKLVMQRVVCWNTLQAALREDGREVRIKHTANMDEKAKQATEILGLMIKQAEASKEAFDHMAGIKFDTTMMNYFLTVCFPASGENKTKAKNMRDAVELLFARTGMGADLAGHTAWGAYNAVTEYVSHHKNYSDKASSLFVGSGQRLIKTAFNTALGVEKISEAEQLEIIKAGA